jgi:hypothetical protein
VRKILLIISGVSLIASASAIAQTDESAVVLPLEAQTCNLPVAPARIPEDADLDALKSAKGNVTAFQTNMVDYRVCLEGSIQNENATDGNKMAVSNAHNYSVAMEERIAEQFNVAVRAYKARKAEEQE